MGNVWVSTMIPICHNLWWCLNKVLKDIAADGRNTMGWCHGFKLHLLYNGCGRS